MLSWSYNYYVLSYLSTHVVYKVYTIRVNVEDVLTFYMGSYYLSSMDSVG